MEAEKENSLWTDLLPLKIRHAIELINSHDDKDSKLSKNIPDPPQDLECQRLGSKIEEIWHRDLKVYGSNKVSLSWVLFKTMLRDYVRVFLVSLVIRFIAIVYMLESFRRLLSSLEHNDLSSNKFAISNTLGDSPKSQSEMGSNPMNNNSMLLDKVLYLSWIMIPFGIYIIGSSSIYIYTNLRCGLKSRIALTQLIQRKSLRLHSSINDAQTKAIVLIANEVTSVDQAHRFLSSLVQGPISMVFGSIWLAVTQTGWLPVLAPLPLLILVVFLLLCVMRSHKMTNRRVGSITSQRIEATSTCMNSIKAIKMYCWEAKFLDRISTLRKNEQQLLKKLNLYTVLDMIIFNAAFRMFGATAILVYFYTYDQFELSILFLVSLMYCFLSFETTLFFSKSLRAFSDLKEACDNIKQYLLLNETHDKRSILGHKKETAILKCNNISVSIARDKEKKNITDTCSDKSNRIIIKNLSVELKSGDLTMVIGPVGVGKSTFLLTLLGETQITEGSLSMSSAVKFAYASQEPWILPASFKDNILLGREYLPERYDMVIQICSLQRDIDSLPNGNDTLIGSKGVLLSGGQKCRLNLARAIYSQADIYLLDDPLSSVDSHVADQIFTNCIKNFLKDKVVVLATHQTRFLDQASNIIVLESNRKPFVGSAADLIEISDLKCSKNLEKTQEIHLEEILDGNKISPQEKFNLIPGKNNSQSSVYIYVIKLAFNPLISVVILSCLIFHGFAEGFVDYFISLWSQKIFDNLDVLTRDQLQSSMFKTWSFLIIVIIVSIVSLYICIHFLVTAIRNSIDAIHNKLIETLMQAEMSFFDQCNSGELSSRYGADLGLVEHLFAPSSSYLANIVICSIWFCIMVGFISRILFILLMTQYFVLILLIKRYLKRIKKLQLMSMSSTSPVFTNLSSITGNLATVRSDQDYLYNTSEKFNSSQNQSSSISALKLFYESYAYSMIIATLWILTSIFLIVVVSIHNESLNVTSTGGLVMLSICFGLMMPGIIHFYSMLDTAMTGIEKIRQLTSLDQEISEMKLDCDHKNKVEWKKGKITFNNVSMKYSEDGASILSSLSFSIKGGERIGLVGRTGAGKSSIISILFRLYPYEGAIEIDDVDIESLPISELRASLGIIPQEPVLFSGTLRKNLDPSDIYSDEQIWMALKVVNLHKHVVDNLNLGLEYQVTEGGRNFSVGQRQLICLVRAILKEPKVLLIDEATANMDHETDILVQKTIKSHFKGCTILTIAHRINTVLDCDRVMVLDSGKIVEFDTVDNLLTLENGKFKYMVEHSGISKNNC